MTAAVDHLYVAALLIFPVYGWYAYRRALVSARAGNAPSRPALYAQTQALEWLLFAAIAAIWFSHGRPLAALGFVLPTGSGFWVGVALTAVAGAYLVFAWRAARGWDGATRARHDQGLGDLRHFLPRTSRDYRHFLALSFSAGLVEEIVYRGFLFWYLLHFMPVWAAVIVSSVVFALGHSYQGVSGMAMVFVIGLGFGVLFVISGSIWLPILLHIVLDSLQGAMVLELARPATPTPPATQA